MARRAVRAFHHPGNAGVYKHHKQAATAYGVSPQLYHKMKTEMTGDGSLKLVTEGKIDAPPPPPSTTSPAAAATTVMTTPAVTTQPVEGHLRPYLHYV